MVIEKKTKERKYIPRGSIESLRSTTRVRPIRDIVQCPRIPVQNRVQEAQWALSCRDTFLDDAVNHGGEDRSAFV